MFHWQNLNESRRGTGSMLRHGRAWWNRLDWEWHIGRSTPAVSFGIGESGLAKFHVSLWLCQFFLSVGGVFSRRTERRECSVRIMDGGIWLCPWVNPDASSRDDPWYRETYILRVRDWLLGRQTFGKEVIETREVVIPMPEGAYGATVKMERCTWRRPRWFAKTGTFADVDIPGGIPFAGKGENSWDCGDDGLYGMHCKCDRVEDAIGKVVASVLRDRGRYGETSESRGRIVMARATAA